MGETPIFDELREMFGQLEIDELIGHAEDGVTQAAQATTTEG
nr:hypothetical protein [Kibdelosporangium sp. MJ126-NF4]